MSRSKKPLVIGLDLDNTLIDYSKEFRKEVAGIGELTKARSKQEIKEYFIRRDGGDNCWQQLQARVYSDGLKNATINPKCRKVLHWLRSINCKLIIISHKTKVSNFDQKINLRAPMKVWLRKNLPFEIPTIFCDSHQQKIDMIIKNKCNVFIDDLPEVVNELEKRSECLPLLLKDQEWRQIHQRLAVILDAGEEVVRDFKRIYREYPAQCYQLAHRGNNQGFMISDSGNHKVFVKKYLRETMANEINVLNILRKCGISNVPSIVHENIRHRFVFMTHCDGETSKRSRDQFLSSATSFIDKLIQTSKKHNLLQYAWAKDGSTCGGDFIARVQRRKLKMLRAMIADKRANAIRAFLRGEFSVLQGHLSERAYSWYEQNNHNINDATEKDSLLFSPSDFGPHNFIYNRSRDQSFFVDFEYAGVDDVVKFLGDFYWHRGFPLSQHKRQIFVDKVFGKYFSKSIQERYNVIVPLIGLEWVLIVLNVFTKEIFQKKTKIWGTANIQVELQKRFDNALRLFKLIKKRYG